MADVTDLQRRFHSARKILLTYPRVLGVGFGSKENQGRALSRLALRVYVSRKLALARLTPTEIIPDKIYGLATDVIQVATVTPLSASNPVSNTALSAGRAITNLRGLQGNSEAQNGGSGLGALGFFAAVNGITDKLDVVLVSNQHVLLAHGGKKGDPVYQPDYAHENGGYKFRRDSLQAVAEISNEGFEGNYVYSYPGEDAAPYFIDCATARLFAHSVSRLQPTFSLDGPRGKTLLRGVKRAHPLDRIANRGLPVRKLGPATGLTFGRVIDGAATSASRDGVRRENNILIRGETRDGQATTTFASAGDSGALIVDERNRAVGLLWGKSQRNEAEAFACHIHPVLNYLNVTPLTYDPCLISRSTR